MKIAGNALNLRASKWHRGTTPWSQGPHATAASDLAATSATLANAFKHSLVSGRSSHASGLTWILQSGLALPSRSGLWKILSSTPWCHVALVMLWPRRVSAKWPRGATPGPQGPRAAAAADFTTSFSKCPQVLPGVRSRVVRLVASRSFCVASQSFCAVAKGCNSLASGSPCCWRTSV